MKLQYISICLAVVLFGCSDPAKQGGNKKKDTLITSKKIDTTNSFKVDSHWITAKKTLKFNSCIKASEDTLDLLMCAEYVYSPFGVIKNKLKFGTSLLANFDVTTRIDTMDIGPQEFNVLKHKESKLLFYFDPDTEGEKTSTILKGEIYDEDVHFTEGVQIGMSLSTFYATFLEHPFNVLDNKFKVIVFTSCIDGIKHIYTFQNDKLTSVKFVTDTHWKVDY